MKLQTFDRSLIREYMLNSSILEQGIRYCQHVTPNATREVARETAIRRAIEFCERKWYNDSTGYISNERIAFNEFVKDVENHRYFYDKDMEKAEKEKRQKEENEREQASRWNKEKERVRQLKAECKENGKDFNAENVKAVHSMKIKSNVTQLGETVAVLAFIAAVIMWIFTSIGNYLIWLPIIIVSTIIFFVLDSKVDPKVPDDYFKKIKNGTYTFDE